MSLAAREALDRRTTPWLFAIALASTLPHFLHLSILLSILATLMFFWGGLLWWQNSRLPSRWIVIACALLAALTVLFEYRTIFGREAGTALLVLFSALKLLEIRSRRDALVSTMLACFVLQTHFFDSESMLTALWLLTCVVLITATLIRLHGGAGCTLRPTLKRAGKMTLQAMPLMLVLYLLFPRITGPLWGLPKDAFSARTGLSDQMAPGTISDLAQSGEIAFRALFAGPIPDRSKLYWRGPVMEDTDGSQWQTSPLPKAFQPPVVEATGPVTAYRLTLEAHQQRWLLTLDAPGVVPANSRITPTLSVMTDRPVDQRRRHNLTAHTEFRFNVHETPARLQKSLTLPPLRNPRTRALAEQWRQADPSPERLVQRALAHFRQEEFFYTLRPPLLGAHPMDDFLFLTRRGFCEHYAAAFVTLMRAAGVPARVVGGYQGGELNPLDRELVVRQSDAHAWAEVWLSGRGWVRVDPTAAVAPSRIESGIVSAMGADEPLPALVQLNSTLLRSLRHRWEAINNGWNQWVLGYNADLQRSLLRRMGIDDPRWQAIVFLLLATLGTVLLAVSAWILYHRPRPDPARQLWDRALRHLRRRRIEVADWEAPQALAVRLQTEHPETGSAIAEIARHYLVARYGRGPINLEPLRQAVRHLLR